MGAGNGCGRYELPDFAVHSQPTNEGNRSQGGLPMPDETGAFHESIESLEALLDLLNELIRAELPSYTDLFDGIEIDS
jgi:hypothetical protein